jgi:hypothetical protein
VFFDNPAWTDCFPPAITTRAQATATIASAAVEMLVERIRSQEPVTERIEWIPDRLARRQSTGPARRPRYYFDRRFESCSAECCNRFEKTMTRRQVFPLPAALLAQSRATPLATHTVREWSFDAAHPSSDPFNDTTLDVVFEGPKRQWRVPAFWAGGREWKARFAGPSPGRYTWETDCSRSSDTGLHARRGSFDVVAYAGANPLLRHGPVGVSADGRYFEHADGAPFFFLGDDWWLGMTSRLRYPDEFRTLAEDRKRKGFTAVKLTAGLNTDTTEFDPRSGNEAGQPWEPGYARIRPQFFDRADQRIRMLVEMGISPSVVGSWGFYLKSMGIERMCRHWRYCVARWGAYPVTWYLAMENDLPYYLSKTGPADTERAQQEWTEVGRYLRQVDPFRRPVSMQSWKTRHSALGGLKDGSLLDFDSLHMGHNDRESAATCIRVVRELYSRRPAIPVIPGEVVFEGIGWQNWQNIQRYVFWGSMLSGASGFCYGANGIWQFNRQGQPFGNSPGGKTWGGDPWDVAMHYPGSAQVGLSKQLLERYPFWKIEPHPDWLDGKKPGSEDLPPFAGGIPGQVRFIYTWHSFARNLVVHRLEPGVRYRAFWFDPVSGGRTTIETVDITADGDWRPNGTPGVWDYVLVMERA